MTPSERELLLRMAHITLSYMSASPYNSNAKDIQGLHQLVDRVVREQPRSGVPEAPERAKEWLRDHLDQRYEVKHLDCLVADNGLIYVGNAILAPRDEL